MYWDGGILPIEGSLPISILCKQSYGNWRGWGLPVDIIISGVLLVGVLSGCVTLSFASALKAAPGSSVDDSSPPGSTHTDFSFTTAVATGDLCPFLVSDVLVTWH